MKEKLKKFFNKDRLFIWICTILIVLFVTMSVLFLKKDVEDNKNKQSEISLCDNEINLNTSWTINEQGNLVGDNLFNINNYSWLYNSIISNYTINITTNNNVGSDFKLLLLNSSETTSNTLMSTITTSGNYSATFTKTNNDVFLTFKLSGNSNDGEARYDISNLQNGTTYNISLNLFYNSANNYIISYIMLNLGSTPLEWEPYGVWYSESNYNNVNEQLQLQSDVNKYGWLSYIDNVEYKVNNSLVKEFTFEELKTSNYIGADGSFNLLTLSMYNNPNYNNVSIDIYFANSIINSDTLPINLFNVSTKEGFNGTITIRDSDSQVVVLNVQDVTTITYENIFSANSEFNNEIYNVEFNFVSPDSATLIFANSNYSLGFQSGFNKGYNVSYSNLSDTINNLNSQVSTLTTNYNNLNSQYETLSTNYATLLDQYNLISQNDYTFSELFWSISAVPFGVLTSTFNVNVMGVNLALCYNWLVNIYGVIMAYKETF